MSIALVIWTAWRVEVEDPWQPGELLFAFSGIFAGAALVFTIALAQGLSPSALLDGIILRPLKHPAVFYVPLYIPGPRMIVAGLLSLSMAASRTFRRRLERSSNLAGFLKM